MYAHGTIPLHGNQELIASAKVLLYHKVRKKVKYNQARINSLSDAHIQKEPNATITCNARLMMRTNMMD